MTRSPKRPVTAIRVAHLAMVLALTAVFGTACVSRAADDSGQQDEMPRRSIEEVLGDYTPRWMAIPGVVGTGIGKCEDQPCIRVMVAKKTPELIDQIPAEVEGYVVDIIETGQFRPRPPR